MPTKKKNDGEIMYADVSLSLYISSPAAVG